MIKATVSDIIIDFLYDPGIQYTIIPKEIYDKLHFRPLLIPIENSGIGVDGHKFGLLCMACLNLKLLQTDGTFYTIEYVPVLISVNIVIPIHGLHSKKAFNECNRKTDDKILTYLSIHYQQSKNVS